MIKHYQRLERWVRLGGVHLGPLRIPFTGKLYPVRPLSVFQWCDYIQALSRLSRLGCPEDEGEALLWLASLPLDLIRPLAAVMVAVPVRDRDLRRITKPQMEALLIASGKVNDFEYIGKETKPADGGNKAKSEAWGMEDTVDALVSVRPCYTHDDLFRMPMQKFLSISKTVERRLRDQKFAEEGVGAVNMPSDAEPCTDQERGAIAADLRKRGIRC